MANTSRTRYALAAVLGTAGIAAATFLGVHSGAVSMPAMLAGIDGAEAFVIPAPAVDEPARRRPAPRPPYWQAAASGVSRVCSNMSMA